MKESKILKILCYIIIPILFLNIILSLFYQLSKDSFNKESKYDKNYFQSDSFLHSYMQRLASEANNLIFRNNEYNSILDGEYKICYTDSEIYLDNGYANLKDFYYLIIYKNISITNVELTTETNKIENIKEYISNKAGQKANIINGNVVSSSEIISTKALQYFSNFENTYYSIEEKTNDNEIKTYTEQIEENEVIEGAPNYKQIKQYYSTNINDFEIYSTYSEKVLEERSNIFYKNLIKQLEPYEQQMMFCMPISSIVLMVIFIYLLISIGHTKEKDKIDFNDLDKIPIEIIFCVVFIVVGCIIAILFDGLNYVTQDNYIFALNMSLVAYFISYILCMVTFVTSVKRIKAKNFIKDSICGRIFILCLNFTKKVINKIKVCYKKMIETWSLNLKISVIIIGYFIIAIILISLNFVGFLIALVLGIYILYKLFERINCYKKIENHLKEMYEGNHTKKLEDCEFTSDFQDIIKYINDLSSGFENAIQEGIKSERMKTDLITNVSHDIKTPLTSIINYVDLLKKENIENEKAKEYIGILDNKSQRLKKLTEDLVEASKASSGNVKLTMEKINICELIKQTTGEFEDKFKNKKLEIISNIPEKEIYIKADNRYMYRIIENLFSNISKYALDSSRVYIDVVLDDSKVKISIKNISQERLNISADELMQRFVRGDKSRTTEGSGLGISISKSLTELQKGKFELNVDGDLFKVELEFDLINL